jgi:hypothetical protein
MIESSEHTSGQVLPFNVSQLAEPLSERLFAGLDAWAIRHVADAVNFARLLRRRDEWQSEQEQGEGAQVHRPPQGIRARVNSPSIDRARRPTMSVLTAAAAGRRVHVGVRYSFPISELGQTTRRGYGAGGVPHTRASYLSTGI